MTRLRVFAAVCFCFFSIFSQAATIGFDFEDSNVGLTDTFTIDIVGGDLFPRTSN